MKRKAILIAIIAALVAGVLTLAMPMPLAALPESDAALAVAAEGETYLAHNRSGRSVILTVAADGNIKAIYNEAARLPGPESTAITALCTAGSKVYFVRARGGVGGSDYTAWELAWLDPKTGESTTLVSTRETAPPRSLNVVDDVVYAAAVGSARQAGETVDTVVACEVDLGSTESEVEVVRETIVPDGAHVISAVCLADGSTVAALDNGRLLQSGVSESKYLNETGRFGAMSASGNYLWCYDSEGERTVRGTGAWLTSKPAEETMLCGAADKDNGAVMLTFADGSVRLTRENGSGSATFNALGIPVGLRVRQRLLLCGAAMLGALAACAVLWTLIMLLRRRKRLQLRLTAAGVCVSLVLCAAMLTATLTISQDGVEEQRMAQADQAAARAAQTIDGTAAPAAESVGTGEGETATCYALYPLTDDALLAPSGDQALCASGLARRLAEAAQSGSGDTRAVCTLTGREGAMAARVVRQYDKPVAILVAASLSRDLSDQIAGVKRAVMIAALAVLIIFSFCFYLLLRRALRPMGELSNRMDDLAVGRTALSEVKCADDELGAMWRSLKELSVGMGIRDYETRSTLESCRRFVPRGLDKLLGCAVITEISFGDSAAVSGPVGLITVNNSDTARDSLSDSAFMGFVNTCYAAITRNIRSLGGILLRDGFDLKSIRVYYPDGADSGLQSALRLLGERVTDRPEGVPSPDFFILLHPSRLLYGIAGTEDEAFPYIASAELEFFSGYAKHFASAGCRLVITDQYRASLEENCSTRYIGFIASGDGTYVFKLYEVLDGYSDLEKKRREQYDGRLQEAIACFYKNDFYLARNLFLAILRMNPDDGIARWYLFASEHYFNNPTGDEPRYDLFGIHE